MAWRLHVKSLQVYPSLNILNSCYSSLNLTVKILPGLRSTMDILAVHIGPNSLRSVKFRCKCPIQLGAGNEELEAALLRLPERLFYPERQGDRMVADIPRIEKVRVQTTKIYGYVLLHLQMYQVRDDNDLAFSVLRNENMKFLNGPALVVRTRNEISFNPDLTVPQFLQIFEKYFPEGLAAPRRLPPLDFSQMQPPPKAVSPTPAMRVPGLPTAPASRLSVGNAGPTAPQKCKASAAPCPPNISAVSAEAPQPKSKAAGLCPQTPEVLQPRIETQQPELKAHSKASSEQGTASGSGSSDEDFDEPNDDLPDDPNTWSTAHVATFISRLDERDQETVVVYQRPALILRKACHILRSLWDQSQRKDVSDILDIWNLLKFMIHDVFKILSALLMELDCPVARIAQTFKDELINGSSLKEINKEDLEELGVKAGPRKVPLMQRSMQQFHKGPALGFSLSCVPLETSLVSGSNIALHCQLIVILCCYDWQVQVVCCK